MKIIIDPRNNFLFSSYYIKGLYEKYGRKNVKYSIKPFLNIDRRRETGSFEHCMLYIEDNGKTQRRVVIDFQDSINIKTSHYDWCDIYAKINISSEIELDNYPKLISIPPGFGIKIWSTPHTLFRCVWNLILSSFKPLNGFYSHLYDYLVWIRRPKIEFYTTPIHWRKDNYVFHASTFWTHQNCMEGTNLYRALFIETCKNDKHLDFEGGLIKKKGTVPLEYKDIVSSKRFSMLSYVRNTKKTLFVFNTPAVLNCHGWKLGEYLAMGKAIISTPLSNLLPFSMIHKKDLLIINNAEELKSSIDLLIHNPTLRKQLEQASRDNYVKYCTPAKVIERIDFKLWK